MENNITPIIRRRRSIFPKSYNDRPISEEIIKEILENANHAPTHKLTEPWRFKVLRGAALQKLGDFMGSWYQKNVTGNAFSEVKHKKMRTNAPRSACVIAICMQRDPENRLPEWEEIAAVACAVQNMWLTCTAHGIGSYWSTPKIIHDMGDFFNLAVGERCLGFFYMGYHDMPDLPAKRTPIEEKTVWM